MICSVTLRRGAGGGHERRRSKTNKAFKAAPVKGPFYFKVDLDGCPHTDALHPAQSPACAFVSSAIQFQNYSQNGNENLVFFVGHVTKSKFIAVIDVLRSITV